MSFTVQALSESDADAMLAVDGAAFSNVANAAERDQVLATNEWDRFFGAYSDGELCGVAGAYGVEVTLPGLVTEAASGVTAVGVLPTHRRRGALTALMARQLDDLAERGECLAVLGASEATIYGRFGYGVASWASSVEISCSRSAFGDPVAGELPLRLITREEASRLAPAWFDAYRSCRPGQISRPASWWPHIFGEQETWKGGGQMFIVACEPVDPSVAGGYAVYRVKQDGPTGSWRLTAREVVAADAEVAAALWGYLLEVDLVAKVVAESISVDDPIRWRLRDHRAMSVTGQPDHLWVRLVDVAAALSARRYRVHDVLVVEVADAFRPDQAGCYRVEGDPTGAEVTRVVAEPDLVMDVSSLGSLFLGGTTASTLSSAGRVIERTEGALGRGDLFFGSDVAPFCLTHF